MQKIVTMASFVIRTCIHKGENPDRIASNVFTQRGKSDLDNYFPHWAILFARLQKSIAGCNFSQRGSIIGRLSVFRCQQTTPRTSRTSLSARSSRDLFPFWGRKGLPRSQRGNRSHGGCYLAGVCCPLGA